MLSEPKTLYKLMILYMLKQVKFPLINSNISDFFVSKEYATYFVVQEALSELLESNLISVENINNTSRYEMTKEGKEALSFFENQITPPIITDINEFIQTNKFRMRNEVATTAEYYKLPGNDLIVHCEELVEPVEEIHKKLYLELSQFNEVMKSAWNELAPHKICQFIYSVSNTFNSFYHEIKILSEEDEKKKRGYLATIVLTKNILEAAINLLGIEAPDKM